MVSVCFFRLFALTHIEEISSFEVNILKSFEGLSINMCNSFKNLKLKRQSQRDRPSGVCKAVKGLNSKFERNLGESKASNMERFLCFFLGSLIINYWGIW